MKWLYASCCLLPLVAGGSVGTPPTIKDDGYEKLCTNIDNRLPCDTNNLVTDTSEGASFGHYIGQATSSQTKDFYNSPEGCPVFQSIWEISTTFQHFIAEYFEAHTVAFPTVQDEILAMGEAMNLPAEIVFIQNACSELYLLFGSDVQVISTPQPVVDPPIYAPYLYVSGVVEAVDQESNKHQPTHTTNIRREHCSDIGLIYHSQNADNSSSARVVQGHNEDWWSGVAESMSVVRASDWLGYLYPGQLPGTSFVVNSYGLSLSMNSLYPSVPGFTYKDGVAYVFAYVLRDVIRSTSTQQVVSKLSGHAIYSGYSLNVMSACETSITNIEGYGDRLGVQTRTNTAAQQDSTVGHFNAYINSNVEQEPQPTSVKRKTCQDHSTFHSPEDVRTFLRDLNCPVFFTDLNGQHGSETLSTWIADPVAGECRRYRLPQVCEKYQSRCSQAQTTVDIMEPEPEPVVYEWLFSCDSSV